MNSTLAAWVETTIAKGTYKWWVLAVVQCSIMLVGVDSTIVNLALPAITAQFNSPLELSQWVIAAYFIGTAVALPAAGRLADILGRKTIFVAGFGIFTVASVLCGIAWNVEFLIAMRVLQAMGAAALLANSNAITLATFPLKEHGFAMGINGTVYSVGYALGYSLGGFMIHALGWRSIFLVNFPIGVFAIILGLIILIEARISVKKDHVPAFDFGGAILSFLALGGLMVGLEQLAGAQMLTAVNGSLIGIGAVSLAAFIWLELHRAEPLLQLRLFKILLFTMGLITRWLNNLIVASCSFLIPFYCQIALGYSAFETGLLMLPYSISLGIVGPYAGWLSDKIGPRWITTGGFVSGGLALLWMSMLQAASPESAGYGPMIQVIAGMAFLGGGSGLFVAPNNSVTLDAVPPGNTGAASGLVWSLGFLGSAVGTAFSATILSLYHVQVHTLTNFSAADLETLLAATKNVFHLLFIASLAGALMCLIRKTPAHHTAKTTAAAPAPAPAPASD